MAAKKHGAFLTPSMVCPYSAKQAMDVYHASGALWSWLEMIVSPRAHSFMATQTRTSVRRNAARLTRNLDRAIAKLQAPRVKRRKGA